MALVGPAAEELFDPVPEQDLIKALNETLKLWNSQPDWAGDERSCSAYVVPHLVQRSNW